MAYLDINQDTINALHALRKSSPALACVVGNCIAAEVQRERERTQGTTNLTKGDIGRLEMVAELLQDK